MATKRVIGLEVGDVMQFRGNSFSWWLLKLLEAVPEEESQGLLSSMFLKIDIKNFFRLRHSCRIRTENSHVCFRRIPKRVTRPVLTLVHDQKQDRRGILLVFSTVLFRFCQLPS